jgi:hypothetical protein
MKSSCFLRVALVLACSVPCSVWGQVSSDATTVNATYSKLAIAMRVHLLMDSPSAAARGELVDTTGPTISMSDMRTGPVSDIAQTPLSQLVSKPSGLVLQVAVGDWSVDGLPGVLHHATTAMADWHQAPYLTEDWNVPFARVLDIIGPSASRYASFTVDLAFRGQERRYAALFLFGQDDEGNATVVPIDHIVGSPALERLLRASITPGPLSSARYRSRPEVKAFANSVRGLPGCAPDPETEMCCDSASGHCGLTPEALPGFAADRFGEAGESAHSDIAAPRGELRPEDSSACSSYNTLGTLNPYSTQDSTSHITGYHTAAGTLQGQCKFTQSGSCSCAPTCHVSVSGVSTTDSGLVSTATHVGNVNYSSADASSGGTCKGAFGVAVQACLFGICGSSVQITISGLSVTFGSSPQPLWTYQQSLAYGPCYTVNY